MNGKNVAIIGAGVAGLTAAHELAERGFTVWVYEGEHDALRRANVSVTSGEAKQSFADVAVATRPSMVGGLAATQWYRIEHSWAGAREFPRDASRISRLELAETANLAHPGDWCAPEIEALDRKSLEAERGEGDAFVRFRRGEARIFPFATRRLGRLAVRLKQLIAGHRGEIAVQVVANPFAGESPGLAEERAREVLLELLAACHRYGLESTILAGERGFSVRDPYVPDGAVVAIRTALASEQVELPADSGHLRHVRIRVNSPTGLSLSDADWTPPPRPAGEEPALFKWEGRWPMLPFADGGAELSEFAKWRVGRIAGRIAALLDRVGEDESLVIGGVVGASETVGDKLVEAGPYKDPVGLALRRAEAVARELVAVAKSLGLAVEDDPLLPGSQQGFLLRREGRRSRVQVRVAGLGALHASEAARPLASQRYVEIRIYDRVLPGEHGYRFFPSFYHHTFDTMKRIPLLVPGKKDSFRAGVALEIMRDLPSQGFGEDWEPTSQTVFDNLRSVELHAIDSGAEGSGRPLERFNTRSLRSLLSMLDTFQETSDVPLRDVLLGQLKVVRYATACAARRGSYESQTWSEFTEARLGGEEYRRLLDHWPQALVGLQASRADARTTGTVLLQLLLDQVRSSGYRDGTLNAPTSEAWLDPWKRYLEQERGVTFACVKVDRFRLVTRGTGEDREQYVVIDGLGCDGETVVDRGTINQDFDYVVVATSVDVTARLGRGLRTSLQLEPGGLPEGFEDSPFATVARLVPAGDAYQTTADSEDPFEHFSGIQYYLDTDHAPLRGHVYYPNSQWRLSSVSQSQFRLDRPDRLDGYTGVISVVIGAFNEVGHNGKTAWACTADEIAAEVWEQITRSLRGPEGPLMPPRYYAIDKNLEFKGPGGTMSRNRTPFLVNSADRVGAFPERAGAYRVHMDHFVFAGTYLQTRTRLVTMEAANESARHAVNAVIRHGGRRGLNTGQLCPIFDPEEREPDELRLLHRIDAELLARGLPHWMDILAVDTRMREHLDRDDGAGGLSLTGAFMAVLESAGGLGGELLRLLRSQLLGR